MAIDAKISINDVILDLIGQIISRIFEDILPSD